MTQRCRFILSLSKEEGEEFGSEDVIRSLKAIELGVVISIHCHFETSEEVIILRGEVEEILYNDSGEETERIHLLSGGDTVAVHILMGCYHTCRSLRSGSVIVEFKNGKYDRETTEDLL